MLRRFYPIDVLGETLLAQRFFFIEIGFIFLAIINMAMWFKWQSFIRRKQDDFEEEILANAATVYLIQI